MQQGAHGIVVHVHAEPRNIRETDQPFPEPALFLLNPDGEVVIIDYSNSPFARPDLRILVEGDALQPYC